MSRLTLGAAGAMLVALLAPAAASATVTVNTTADLAPAVNECNGVPGDCSLRRALDKAASTDTIDVPVRSTHYAVTAGELVVDKNLTIQGTGVGRPVIDGGGNSRVFHVVNPSTAATFSHLTIVGGKITGTGPLFGGAGIRNDAGALTVTRSVFSNDSVTATAMGCCNGGGAIWNNGTDHFVVTDSHFVGNTFTVSGVGGDCCNGGGAIYYNGAGVDQTLTRDTFSRNTASINDTTSGGCCVGGGAYFNDGGTLTIVASTFDGNSLSVGGGSDLSGGGAIFHDGGTFSVTNSTLTGNKASPLSSGTSTGGGAILYDGGTGTVTNTTIARNATAGTGGDILSEPTITFKNTIVSGGTATAGPNCASVSGSAFVSAGYNLENADSCGFHAMGDLPNRNPQLRRLANNGGPTATMALPLSSPAVDHGADAGLTLDQRGKVRPFDFPGVPNALGGNASDIGAFELQRADIPNGFAFGKLTRDKKKGTATLIVILPGRGKISLTGKGIVSHTNVLATGARVVLDLTPAGKTKTRLANRHKAKVKIRVTFTPTGGLPNTRTKTVKLVERKRL